MGIMEPTPPGVQFKIDKVIFEGTELYRVFFGDREICVGPHFESIEWLVGSAAQFHKVEVELCRESIGSSSELPQQPSL